MVLTRNLNSRNFLDWHRLQSAASVIATIRKFFVSPGGSWCGSFSRCDCYGCDRWLFGFFGVGYRRFDGGDGRDGSFFGLGFRFSKCFIAGYCRFPMSTLDIACGLADASSSICCLRSVSRRGTLAQVKDAGAAVSIVVAVVCVTFIVMSC